MSEDTDDRMKEHGVRPTAVRSMLLKLFDRVPGPVSAQRIESELDTVDRSTISRSLTLFVQKGLLHVIDDGSSTPKYEVCPSHHHHNPNDGHMHFHCRKCGRTICLEGNPLPDVNLPEGFEPDGINCIITGLCPRCS